ncbi:MAG TPA: sigma factor, partial [Candidatus Eremiobacteraceae bacterium]|nr:sigma factor [Candidatus Eremiobacteraceae bacterium]
MVEHEITSPLGLFSSLLRIQLRMETPSTTEALGGSASLLFSTFMADDSKSLAVGLKRRDPELLEILIEQYQYRLFRYLLYITGSRERAEDFFQDTWIRV